MGKNQEEGMLKLPLPSEARVKAAAGRVRAVPVSLAGSFFGVLSAGIDLEELAQEESKQKEDGA